MPLEIERKFLVVGEFRNLAFKKSRIRQGYLASGINGTVRIRTKDDQGYITIKGKSDESGISRYEWEKEISFEDAQDLLNLCSEGYIDKYRYEVAVGKHIFEVDEFLGENQGLLLAEVELESETEAYDKPEWLGLEVTGDRNYYNSQLVKHPFSKWKDTIIL
ncbi:MAG TPA: CYTH domain-containing protein [Bacteroidales bacterium]|nr:CYTH domain-containing protein [Bacteroidales bacterium]